jgi:hypothetical protein
MPDLSGQLFFKLAEKEDIRREKHVKLLGC